MRRQTIPFEVIGGHVVLDVGGVRVLLDTGSQLSFGDVPSLRILGEGRQIPQTLELGDRSRTVREICEGLQQHTPVPPGFAFEALLGTELLAGTTLEIDFRRGELRIEATPGRAAGGMLLPRATVEIEGRSVQAILDTGAWRSYVVPEVAEGLPGADGFTDYNPILGPLELESVRARFGFEGAERTVEAGIARGALLATLGGIGVSAIVGTDVTAASGIVRMRG